MHNNVERIMSVYSNIYFDSKFPLEKLDIIIEDTNEVFKDGFIYLPSKLTKEEIRICKSLISEKHPLIKYLKELTKNYFSTNILDVLGTEEIKSYIDFEYSSIPNLLNALGYRYLDNTKLGVKDKNLVFGLTPDVNQMVLYTRDNLGVRVVEKSAVDECLREGDYTKLLSEEY